MIDVGQLKGLPFGLVMCPTKTIVNLYFPVTNVMCPTKTVKNLYFPVTNVLKASHLTCATLICALSVGSSFETYVLNWKKLYFSFFLFVT